MEVAQECIEHYMELHFGANIMDGDYDRIKVKEVTDGFSLVKRMREAQVKRFEFYVDDEWWEDRAIELEKEVDEYLKKMTNESSRMVETERRKEETQAISMGR